MNILPSIPGQYVAKASQTLPNCESTKDKYMETECRIPEFGTVFFLFRRFRNKHGKSVNWFWQCEAAVAASDVVRPADSP